MIYQDKIHKSWYPFMESALLHAPIIHLFEKVLPNCTFLPAKKDIFNVFEMALQDIKVVIIENEPYHLPDKTDVKRLEHIAKEALSSDYDNCFWVELEGNKHYAVKPEDWYHQGVFSLNTALTVERFIPGSHLSYWRFFCAAVVEYISLNHTCLWVMWGQWANRFQIQGNRIPTYGYDRQSLESIPMDDKAHYIISGPQPTDKNFIGCDNFYFVNKILGKQGKTPVVW